jgi:hypothetical protein
VKNPLSVFVSSAPGLYNSTVVYSGLSKETALSTMLTSPGAIVEEWSNGKRVSCWWEHPDNAACVAS